MESSEWLNWWLLNANGELAMATQQQDYWVVSTDSWPELHYILYSTVSTLYIGPASAASLTL